MPRWTYFIRFSGTSILTTPIVSQSWVHGPCCDAEVRRIVETNDV